MIILQLYRCLYHDMLVITIVNPDDKIVLIIKYSSI